MAYYTALINAWNNVTQPPPGVAGAALLAGDTTLQKIAKVNAWTVTGTIPTTITVPGTQIANCINWPEFTALTTTQQIQLLTLCNQPGQLLGGSSNTTHLLVGMLLSCFTTGSVTIANLTALANAQVQPWWQVSVANGGAGLNGLVSLSDTQAAGLS